MGGSRSFVVASLTDTIVAMAWSNNNFNNNRGGGGNKWGGKGVKGNNKGTAVQSSKGKAIVEFTSAFEAQQAVAGLNGSQLDDRLIKVESFSKYGNSKFVKGDTNAKIYIGNLAFKTRSWKLKEHFSQAGNVKFAKVLRYK